MLDYLWIILTVAAVIVAWVLVRISALARMLKGSVEDTCKMSSQTGFCGTDALCEPSNQASGSLG